MFIVIEKDPATKVPKECSEDEAAGFAVDFPVTVVVDGIQVPYADWKADQDTEPKAKKATKSSK